MDQEHLNGNPVSSKTLPGNKYLKAALGIAALPASHSKDTYLSIKYRRIAARRGPDQGRRRVRTQHLHRGLVWNMLANGECYADPGADHFTKLDPLKTKNRADCPALVDTVNQSLGSPPLLQDWWQRPLDEQEIPLGGHGHGNSLKVFDVMRSVDILAPYDIPPVHDEVE